MENEILIGSNSDLIVQNTKRELQKVMSCVKIKEVYDLNDVITLNDGQVVIIDLSVYTSGLIDRLESFKRRFPYIELIAVTYTNDELIDQMLVKRGIDQVASREELPYLVKRLIEPRLKTTG